MNTIFSDVRTPDEEKQIVQKASTGPSHVDQLGHLIPVLCMSVTYEKQSRMAGGYSQDAMKLGLHTAVRHSFERAKVEHKLGEAPQRNPEQQVREAWKLGQQWEEEGDGKV